MKYQDHGHLKIQLKDLNYVDHDLSIVRAFGETTSTILPRQAKSANLPQKQSTGNPLDPGHVNS